MSLCSQWILLLVFLFAFFIFHCRSFSPSICTNSHRQYKIFTLFFQRNSSALFFISRSIGSSWQFGTNYFCLVVFINFVISLWRSYAHIVKCRKNRLKSWLWSGSWHFNFSRPFKNARNPKIALVIYLKTLCVLINTLIKRIKCGRVYERIKIFNCSLNSNRQEKSKIFSFLLKH